ncbi:MAG TPA: glutamyl-tRNA reductase [Bryobacteraceae bacterium]|jgi:glutamyl-tRNA reductase|nr:glutamyl-tRNA reductase [Bryobacteraceae bacterium]
MRFSITGVNHKSAPVEVRERLAFDEPSIAAALLDLKSRPGFCEGMILSTCNRVEVALTCEDATALLAVDEFLADTRHVARDWVTPYLYRYEDGDAIRHLFRVASSLDSMVVGEPQILGQLKSAYALAKEHGAVSGFLDTLLTRAFNVAKRVRSETEIGANAVSVSYAAVELARDIFGTLDDKKVMIVGAGKMSELAARHLRRSGATHIFVTNRTPERAVEMAQVFDGKIIEYTKLMAFLPEVDIVITSSGAPHYILTRDEMKKVIDARRNRPMFLIDIAVPRNIEPSVNKLDNVFLYDIDDLQKVVDTNLVGRMESAEEAEAIIREEVERMMARLKTREVVPTIVSLQEQLEKLRIGELTRMRGKFGALTPEQEEALIALTKGIINKIAHGPISELRRQANEPDGHQIVLAIRKVFRLRD